jgi:iron transport multicopper oxidase
MVQLLKQRSQNTIGTEFLVNNVSFERPSVPVLLQILNGVDPSQLLPNGSIYQLGSDQSVEISIPGSSNTGGPVS